VQASGLSEAQQCSTKPDLDERKLWAQILARAEENAPPEETAEKSAPGRKARPQGLKRLRKNSAPGGKATPQGLKPNIFSIIYGPTKVVP
jgi:hypothetical protein